jgi:hypothetical protein
MRDTSDVQRNPFAPPDATVDDVLRVEEGSFRLDYEVRKVDYILFVIIHQSRMKSLHVLYASVSIIFALPMLDKGVPLAVFGGVLAYLAQMTFQVLFTVALFSFSKNPRLYTRHQVETNGQAFIVSTRYAQQAYQWFGIDRVLVSRWLVAIYVNRQSAHIIPRRAFLDSITRDSFVRLVKTLRKESVERQS